MPHADRGNCSFKLKLELKLKLPQSNSLFLGDLIIIKC
jgi:hypothetical protein